LAQRLRKGRTFSANESSGNSRGLTTKTEDKLA